MSPRPHRTEISRGRALALAALAVAGCGGSIAVARPPQVEPTERLMEHSLPDGVAETALAEGASGTEGGARQSGLLWIVATGSREYVYAMARCERLQTGESPGEALAVARCGDHRYAVSRRGDQLELRRDGAVAASLTVPEAWRVRVRSSAP